jgi:hypothetical protein
MRAVDDILGGKKILADVLHTLFMFSLEQTAPLRTPLLGASKHRTTVDHTA